MYYTVKIISAATAALWSISHTNLCAWPDRSLKFCLEASFPPDSICLTPPIHTNCIFTFHVPVRDPEIWIPAGPGRAMALWPPGLLVHLNVDCSLPVYTNLRSTNFRNLEYCSRNLRISKILAILELEKNQTLKHLNTLWDKSDHLCLTQL